MSLNSKTKFTEIAKIVCRDLRKRSTYSEEMLWNELRNRKLINSKFYRQYPLFYDFIGKESFFIADFFCKKGNLIIELDGQLHKYKFKEDEFRTDILNFLGYRVIRFKNEEVEQNLNLVLDKIKKELLKHPNAY